MLEALVAGTPVVAADTPAHREAALYGAPGSVQFVSPEGSPLEVADAVSGATGARAPSPAPVRLPTHEAAAEARFALYTELLAGGPAGDAPGTGRALPAREPRSAGREVGIRA
jgi:hypothetical protein